MFTVAFENRAGKEFFKLDPEVQETIAKKIRSLEEGNFHGETKHSMASIAANIAKEPGTTESSTTGKTTFY